MEAFVELLARGQVGVEDLISTRLPVDAAAAAYDRLVEDETSPLGVVLTYTAFTAQYEPRSDPPRQPAHAGSPITGVIGAGSFSQRFLIPGLRDAGFKLALVASANGLSAAGAAKRFGIDRAVAPDELLHADELDVVAIASRHGSHAAYALTALELDKAVFVEKPPALTTDELERLRDASRGRVLQVGFNRRFAPLARTARDHVSGRGHPIELLYRVAAGRLAADHWLNDAEEGGGRLLGEGCHFVDFACWFVGARPVRIFASVPPSPGKVALAQRFAVTMTFADDSVATILYGSESAPSVEKELIEAHAGGRSAVIHDYRRLELRGEKRARVIRDHRQDKGHREQFLAFRRLIDGGRPEEPDPLDTMAMCLQALASACTDSD